MTQSETTKGKVQKERKAVLVRYGKMRLLGWFTHSGLEVEHIRTRVIIKTRRGLEMGDIVGPHCYKGGSFRSSKERVEDYYSDRTKDYPLTDGGTFVRYATADDINETAHLEISARNELEFCQKLAEEMELPMKIVEAEHLLGGERIVLYFSSETRVDFRELVKQLAREYQTRIELRQIGARDEARLISDYESCGQQCCCQRFLKILAPVNMRMAKVQKATLDPSKISGHCGRLKCCLRYEDSTYRELKKLIPNKNTLVRTANGEGRVINTHILTQLVEVMYKDGRRESFPVDEIEIISEAEPAKRPEREGAGVEGKEGKSEEGQADSNGSGRRPEQGRGGRRKNRGNGDNGVSGVGEVKDETQEDAGQSASNGDTVENNGSETVGDSSTESDS